MTTIVWDFDGTLANSYPGMVTAVKDSLKNNFKIEVSRDSIYTDIKETSIRHYVTELLQAKDKTAEDVERDVNIFYHDYKLFEKENQDKIVLLPHAKSAMEKLATSGVEQFVVTHRDESIHELADQLGIAPYLKEIITVEAGFVRKPNPEMLNYLIEKYHLNKAETWAIGDRKIDIDFANNAGIQSTLISEGATNDFGQTETVSDLNEVLNLVI